MKYKTLIFDFGGVLYNIDYYASTRKFAKLSDLPELFANMPQMKILDLPSEFEKGNITEQEFRDFLRKEYHLNASNDEIDKAWNSMLLGIKPDSISFIKSLKDKYQLILLSNTNSIHYEYFKNECKDLLNLFDHTIFSYHTGMRKPDVDIYNFALNQASCLPQESIFFDDTKSNLIGAQKAGMNVFHFDIGYTLSDLLHTI